MATLILEHDGRRQGAVLNGRMVIGRHGNSHLVIADRSVSRVHAWIGKAGNTYFVADSGSRTGTIVNGRTIDGRRTLHDGDQIQIGPAKILFQAEGPLPSEIELLDKKSNFPNEDGIYVECSCGAPIWAPWEFGGRKGRCRHCGRSVALPAHASAPQQVDLSNETLAAGMPSLMDQSGKDGGAEALTPSLRRERSDAQVPTNFQVNHHSEYVAPQLACGACQSLIGSLEKTITCAECGVSFHASCWIENRGCSSYGCKQVGILDTAAPDIASVAESTISPAPENEAAALSTPHGVQWSYVLLPASGLTALAGLFAFGLPSLALAIGLMIYTWRSAARMRGLLTAALVVSVVGAVAGSAFSVFWWLQKA